MIWRFPPSLLLAAILIPATAGVCAPQKQKAPANRPFTPRPAGPPPIAKEQPQTGNQTGARTSPPTNPMAGKFPPLFDRLAKMPADEREKALATDPHFKRMTPERQTQVRENLARFANMPPEQQQLMRDRFEIVNSMPPANRERIREVFPRWRQLPEDRRQPMRDELHALTAMSPADREKHFNDPEFQKAFSSKEQKLLKDLSDLVR